MDLCNANEIHDLLSRRGFHFSKSLGQNFLTASWVPERIADESGADEAHGVLEIGPGIGCLTTQLARRAAKVTAIELDDRLIPILGETLAEHDNVNIVSGDVMKLELPQIIADNFAGLTPCVCANLPYNITTPVLTRLIECRLFDTITVMIQREVALRICAEPGTADYGAFGIFVQYYCDTEMLFDVPPHCFTPAPKVTSSVIRLTVRSEPAVDVKDEKLFFRIVRGAFLQRRKTLVNALSSAIGEVTKSDIADAIAECGLSESVRGEVLSLSRFAALSDAVGNRI